MMQVLESFMNSSLVLILAFVAEYMYSRLRSATHIYKQETDGILSLEIQSSEKRSREGASSYSFRLYSVGGGLIWLLLYVLLWVQVGVSLNHVLVALFEVDFPIYIAALAIAFYRGAIAVGKADNARTDRKYKLNCLR